MTLSSFFGLPSDFRAEANAGGRAEGRHKINPDDIQVFDVHDFLMLDVPKRQMLLEPILPAKGLMMVHAPAGVGKTLLGIGAACAIATGTQFLRWKAPEPRRVLYVDGEMPTDEFQERLTAALKVSGKPTPGYLNILNTNVLNIGLPDIATPEGRYLIETKVEELGGVDVINLDNLSALCRAFLENEGDSWQPMQDWLLSMRRRGISVVMFHHTSKGGTARGTSRRLDVLDTVIALKHPEDYNFREGARFVVEVEKARGFCGAAAEPFEARLETIDGAPHWRLDSTIDPTIERVAQLLCDGWKLEKIAKELGIGLGTVHRYKMKALELNLSVTPLARAL